jgi:hypothetical protein
MYFGMMSVQFQSWPVNHRTGSGWAFRDGHATTGRRPLLEQPSPRQSLKPYQTRQSCDQPVHPVMLANGSQLSGWFPLTDVDVSDTTPPATL